LVATQVALSLVLLTIAGFTVQLARRELAAGPGFRTTHMAKLSVDPSQARYGETEAVRFFSSVLDDARQLPGVESASLPSAMPLFSDQLVPVVPAGKREDAGTTTDTPPLSAWTNSVDDRYFATMDIAVLAGRAFTAADDEHAPLVAMVNDTLARHFW